MKSEDMRFCECGRRIDKRGARQRCIKCANEHHKMQMREWYESNKQSLGWSGRTNKRREHETVV